MLVYCVIESWLSLRIAFEDARASSMVIGSIAAATVRPSRAFVTGGHIATSVLDLSSSLRYRSNTIIMQLNNFGDFVHIDRKTSLAASAAQIIGTVTFRATRQLLQTVGVESAVSRGRRLLIGSAHSLDGIISIAHPTLAQCPLTERLWQ